jgi:hypothetical protein
VDCGDNAEAPGSASWTSSRARHGPNHRNWSRFEVTESGKHELNGVSGSWRLYRVRSCPTSLKRGCRNA